MYVYTEIQIGDLLAKHEIFEIMEEQVKTAKTIKSAVGSMEYALHYYPSSSGYQITGSRCDILVETLRQRSVLRMVATLEERFPESSMGNSHAAWIEAYGDKSNLDAVRESEWYKTWYAPLEILRDTETLNLKTVREND
jgi:hypothetical protein